MPYVSYHSVREQLASQRLSKSIAKFQSNAWSTGSDRSRHRDQCEANLASSTPSLLAAGGLVQDEADEGDRVPEDLHGRDLRAEDEHRARDEQDVLEHARERQYEPAARAHEEDRRDVQQERDRRIRQQDKGAGSSRMRKSACRGKEKEEESGRTRRA